METQTLHRGRLIDHIQLVVADLPAARRFYGALLAALDIPIGGEVPNDFFWTDELFVSSQKSRAAAGELTGRVHLAFQTKDRESVERVYRAGLDAGGRDHGKPGERPYHPGYYAAFLLDPAGNNIELVFHGPAKRTAGSIEITF